MFGSGWCGWREGEWMRGLDLGFINAVGTGVLDVGDPVRIINFSKHG